MSKIPDYNNFSQKDLSKLCKKYEKLEYIIPGPIKRIIAIGDTHGDYDMTIKALLLAKVIKINGNNIEWVGGNTYVIQIGDQIDRCRPNIKRCDEMINNRKPGDINILNLFTNLHTLALKSGGAVYSLLGNHEIMNVLQDLRYVSYEDLKFFSRKEDNETKKEIIKELKRKKNIYNNSINNIKKSILKGKIIDHNEIYKRKKKIKMIDDTYNKYFKNVDLWKAIRKYHFKPGNKYAKFMACTRLSILVIGDCLFVHAGVLPDLAKKYKDGIIAINLIVSSWLLNKIKKSDIKHLLKNTNYSPFWPRILGKIRPNIDETETICKNNMTKTLNIFNEIHKTNIKYMVVGHTPQFNINKKGINSTCSGKLWRIDIGISDAFNPYSEYNKGNRKLSVLEINQSDEKTRFNILSE